MPVHPIDARDREFTERFAAGLAGYGDRPCIEFEGRWYSGNEVTAYADAIAAVLREAGVADDAPVGLVVRNRLPHAAAIMGFIAAGRTVSMIYSFQSPEAIGRDIETLGLSAIVADERGLDRRGHRGGQAGGQRGRRDLAARRPPSRRSAGSSAATKPVTTPKPNPVWHCRF